MKNKHLIKIENVPDKSYYKLLELKAKLKSKNWLDFIEKIGDKQQRKILEEKEE